MRCSHDRGCYFAIGRTRDDVQYKEYLCHRCGASLRFYIKVPSGKWKPASTRLKVTSYDTKRDEGIKR